MKTYTPHCIIAQYYWTMTSHAFNSLSILYDPVSSNQITRTDIFVYNANEK